MWQRLGIALLLAWTGAFRAAGIALLLTVPAVSADETPWKGTYRALLDCVHEYAITRSEVNVTATELAVAAVSECDDELNALQLAYIEKSRADIMANSAASKLPPQEIAERISDAADRLRSDAAEKAKASAIRILINHRWVAMEERKKAQAGSRPRG